MSPFRLFGRRARPTGDEPDPWLDDPAPAAPGQHHVTSTGAGAPGHPGAAPTGSRGHVGAAPGRPTPAAAGSGGDSPAAWSAAGTAGPATVAARPSLWTAQRPPQGEPAEPEPVTDPFGFAPVSLPRPRTGDLLAGWAPRSPAGEQAATHRTPQAPPPGTDGTRPADPPLSGAVRSTATAPGTVSQPPRPPTPDEGLPIPPVTDPADRPAGSTPCTSGHPPPSTTGGPADETDRTAPPTADASGPPLPAAPDGTAATGCTAVPATPGGTAVPATPGGTAVPAAARGAAVPAAAGSTDRAADPSDGIDPAEASALAGAFAADLLSWDEDDPARRGRALGAHLASPADAGLLGWTGTGRQRADLVLPGRVRSDGERAYVDVRVRVVPYRRVDARTPGAPEPEPADPLGGPAAAPAPAARGWRGLGARWVRIEVAVVRAGDRLVVDAGPAGDLPAGPSPADLAGRTPGRPR